jgi:hypothetical protein
VGEGVHGQSTCVNRRGRITVDTIRPYAIDIAVRKVSKPAVIPLTAWSVRSWRALQEKLDGR